MTARLALREAVQGARHVVESYTWPGNLSLTGATLTGTKREKYKAGVTAVDGTLTPDADQAANPGLFTWDYGPGDVGTAGVFFVQLKATFANFDATIESRWVVHGLQSASAVAAEAVVGVLQSEADWLTIEKAATEAAAAGNLLQSDGDNSEDSGIAAADVALTADVLPIDAGINTVGSGRDIAASDGGKILEVTATAALNCPDGLDAGLQCAIVSIGGTTTITATTTLQYLDGGAQTAASGVTVNTQCTLYHRGSNVWLALGDVTAI